MLSDAIFGAINGALAITGMNAFASAITGGIFNGLQIMFEMAILGEKLNWTKVGISTLIGFFSGLIPSGFDAFDISKKYDFAKTKLLTVQSEAKKKIYEGMTKNVKKSIKIGTAWYMGTAIVTSTGASLIFLGLNKWGGC